MRKDCVCRGQGEGLAVRGRPHARPFDGPQGERPLLKDGFRLSGAGMIRLRRTGSHRVGEGFVD